MNDSDLERWLDNDLSIEELAELESWLKASEANREQFVRLNFRDQQLRECVRADADLSTAEPEEKIVPFPTSSQKRRTWIAAAAALVVAGVSWLTVNFSSQSESVAIVQSIRKADLKLTSGDSLAPGKRLSLEEGRIALKFESGAKLALVAPAELIVQGPNSAELLRGQATVRVPGKIKGFALTTPVEKVIDLGTAFGVEVSPAGDTAISVFEGEVKLGNDQHLYAGSAVSVSEPKAEPKEIPYTEGEFAESWQLSFGIEAVSGRVKLATPSQRPNPGKVHDPESLVLFPEREEVELPKGFAIDGVEPGTYQRPFRKRSTQLQQSTTVDSYLLQYHPGNSPETQQKQTFVGELKFDRPVIGLILQKELLIQSDSTLGYSVTDFSGIERRGINVNDVVTLSPDRTRLKISFDVSTSADQIRVLIASGNYPD